MPYPGGTIETRSYYNTAPGTPLASVFLQPGGVNAVELVATFTLDAAGGESRLSLGSGGGAVSSTGGYWAGVELQSIDSDIAEFDFTYAYNARIVSSETHGGSLSGESQRTGYDLDQQVTSWDVSAGTG